MKFSLQRVNAKLALLRRIPIKYLFVAGVLFVMLSYIIVFREQTVAYNYGGETCAKRLVLLPGVFRQSGGSNFDISTHGGWELAGQKVSATSLCVTPVASPTENSSEAIGYAPWGGWLGRFTYHIATNQHPVVNAEILKEPIPVSRELKLPLSEPDATFSYRLKNDDKQALCQPSGGELACDIPDLGLKQGAKYTLALEKYFKEQKINESSYTDVETLSPLTVVDSSIKNDATVYDKPTSVKLSVDKALQNATFSVRRMDGEAPIELQVSTEMAEREATITFAEELPRQAVIELKAEKIEAVDGSTTLDPFVLTFKTSGGPKVVGVNAGSSGVAIGSQIVVTFDQELAADQDIGPLMVMGGGVNYQARRGNQLLFSTGGAGRCQDIYITLKPDIKSPFAISGQSAWQYNGRTLCYTVTTIGTSAQGRPINAYHFGASGPAVVYTGAIHGSELSTRSLMDRWVQELDANPGMIPTNKRVIVIPAINPDGVAAARRTNVRNVDLNRNFDVSDWQKDIQHTNGSAFPGGGGETSMSEPETKAIAGFIAQQRPELVISYHSIGGLVISNSAGQAGARASQYSSLSGYRLSSGDGGEFGYQITGTADDYYREKLGVPSIIVELGSHSYHQFERNKSAMWAMMR